MRKLILHMAISLDGVVAPEQQDAFDLADQGVWDDLFQTLESVDAVLIGAAMHGQYLSHWQKALSGGDGPNEKRYAEIAAKLPHFVLSRTLKKIDWPNASVLEGGVAGIAGLKTKPGRDIMMWGGATAAGAAIEAGFVDEYQLSTHPVIAGRGKKLWTNVSKLQRIRALDTKQLPSGIVIEKYAHVR
jgi:riboflavin biosynthesis pyrimidine reductase